MTTHYGVSHDAFADPDAFNEGMNKDLDFIRVELDGTPLSVHYATHTRPSALGDGASTDVFSYLIFYRYEDDDADDA